MAALRKVPSALARPGRAARDAWTRASGVAARRHGSRPRAFQVAFTLVRDRSALRGMKKDSANGTRDVPADVPAADSPARDLPQPGGAAANGAVPESGTAREEAVAENAKPAAVPDPAAPDAPASREAAKKAEKAEKADETGAVTEASMSRQELYRKAQELDIPGRSRMTKAELAEAIQQTSRSTPPAK